MKTETSFKQLNTTLKQIFANSQKYITANPSHTSHTLISNNLITSILCSYGVCSDHLHKFNQTFNKLLNTPNKNNQTHIKVFILENKTVFQKIESIFLRLDWSTSPQVDQFNLATHNTSKSKCTADNKFYIIKCYDHFFYLYNTKSNECLMVVKNEKKVLTMINVLLLTPYLLYGDLYAVHGGLVSDGKNNVLLCNTSLGGKTTFAILFLSNGWQIITEETTYITKHGKILNYNIRNYFNIRIGTYLEFKDFFTKAGIINHSFLSKTHLNKKELFEFGKKEQLTIDFDILSKNICNMTTNQITHILKVSIKNNKSGIDIEKNNPTDSVTKFLELSLAPTVMLFKSLIKVNNKINRKQRKKELTQIFKNTKNYSVSSGFDYRKNFNFLTRKIGI